MLVSIKPFLSRNYNLDSPIRLYSVHKFNKLNNIKYRETMNMRRWGPAQGKGDS